MRHFKVYLTHVELYWSIRHQISLTHEGSYGTTRPLGPVPAVLPVWRRPQAGSGPQQRWRAQSYAALKATSTGFLRRLRTANARHLSDCRGKPPVSSLPPFYCHDGDEQPLVCSVDKINNDELHQMQLTDTQSALFHCLPPDDKLARQLIFESQDYVMDNGLLFHLYYPRGPGHRTEIKTAGCPISA